MSIIELRQYTLLPGKRDVLISLFEREFVEPQEACGIQILGTFRHLDDDSKFVWLRSFPDMDARGRSLSAFYGGPAWRRHRDAANATMVDSDNVLLLRAAWRESDFTLNRTQRVDGVKADRSGNVEAVIVSLAEPADTVDFMYFCDEIVPLIETAGGVVLACLTTEESPNNFPILPIREGEQNLVWFAGFSGERDRRADDAWRAQIVDAIKRWPGATANPQILRLQPTERSRLTAASATQIAAVHALH